MELGLSRGAVSEVPAHRLAGRSRSIRFGMTSTAFSLEVIWLRLAMLVMLAYALSRPLFPGNTLGPPCLFRWLTGIPCPLCGMTTSVFATVQLHFGEAFAANPWGPILVAAGLLLFFIRIRTVRIPFLLLAIVLGTSWLFELYRFALL